MNCTSNSDLQVAPRRLQRTTATTTIGTPFSSAAVHGHAHVSFIGYRGNFTPFSSAAVHGLTLAFHSSADLTHMASRSARSRQRRRDAPGKGRARPGRGLLVLAAAAGRERARPADATRGPPALVLPGGHTIRGDQQGHLLLRERVAPQSEVIRAIFWEDSPCCEAPHHTAL